MKTFPLVASAILALFSGCASVSVTGVRQHAEAVRRPAQFYVANFDTRGGQWNITSRSRTPEQFKRETANALADALTANMNAYVGPTRRIGNTRAVPADGWLITGRFIRVSEGNPAARIIVGLGAGGSKMETETVVLDGASGGRPVLQFATTGGSNAMPGMIISSGPAGAVSNAVQQATRGVRDDTKRTARMITASVAEAMVQRGWLESARLKTKQPGKFQILQPQGTPHRAVER
ncbi:DUF4410 domain-containing protein [Verrucomicrobiota bacterium sgz303538]